MKFLSICLVLFFVALAAAEGHHENHQPHHQHHMGGGHHQNQCAYKSTQGFHYDLRMLASALRERDWKIYNSESKSTFHLNPCGSVHVPGCPQDSAVCEVDEKQQGINFGSSAAPVWADGTDGHTFEITFGNGELCNNGVPRKSIVTFSCSIPTQPGPFRTHVTEIDEEKCTVNILVESPHACPVNVFCQSIKDSEVCGRTQDLCFWHEGHCMPSELSWIHQWASRHHVSPAVFLAWVGVGSFLMSCSLALCCCACCHAMKKKRRTVKMVLPIKKKACKKTAPKKKACKKVVEEVAAAAEPVDSFPMQEMPQGVYVYQPLQNQLQDIYAQPNIYGYHMVQLAPGQHLQFAPQ